MVQQPHGQAGFIALLAAASEGREDSAPAQVPAPIHGASKPKRKGTQSPASGQQTATQP